MRTSLMLAVIFFAVGASAQLPKQQETKQGEGSRRESQIIQSTLGALEAEGLVRREQVDEAKTGITQLVSQKLSKLNSRRMYSVEFFLRDGNQIAAIARRDESSIPEQSGLVVYVISKILQPDGKPVPPKQQLN